MMNEGRWVVPAEKARSRLDHFLTVECPALSRSQIQTWIRSGNVQVNGRTEKTGYHLKPRDEVTLFAPQQSAGLPEPEDIPLRILYEDEHLAVIDKPAGLVCHAGAGRRTGTLVNALLHRWGPLEAGDPLRPGIVHRLDRFTSGAMVVARTARAHRDLSLQFKSREIRKEYIALVYGNPVLPSGTVDAPVGRDRKDRKKISVRARRQRAAVTHYRVTAVFDDCSLLRIRPETGRTHQIRVHLASIGHPVVGDRLYGGHRTLPKRLQAEVARLGRFFLHASALEFRHPHTREWMAFSAPLPPELESLLEVCRCR